MRERQGVLRIKMKTGSGKRRIETKTSRTAEMTCLCRAVSSLEKDPFYRSGDQIARDLLPGFLRAWVRIPHAGRLLVRAITAKGIYEYVIARTKYMDSVFRQALAERFPQILIFGTGFDTRALRFEAEARDTAIFELDAPPTLEAKIAQYRKRGLSIPSNVVWVPIDFDKESLPEKLDQAGFQRNIRSLFVLEGVLEYLQPESVDRTLRTIQDYSGEGSEILFNYAHASVIRREGTRYGERGGLETLDRVGEPWHFGLNEGEIGPFLAKYGFTLIDHRDTRELEEMYFTNEAGGIVGHVTGTHCLARAVKTAS